MRFLLLTVLVAGCGPDTFETPDGGDAATTDDAISGGDGSKADAAPFDPSQLGSLVLWLDAADARGLDAGDLVTQWPDHQNKYQTAINVGVTSQVCKPGLHAANAAALNNKPVVTFCAANLGVKDTGTLRLGTNAFYIAAVLSPGSTSALDAVLFTKTPPGQSQPLPGGLTFLATNASQHLQGWLNGTVSVFSQNTLDAQYVYVTFVRTSASGGSQISVRVNGVSSNPVTVNTSDDISANGADVGVGGYVFDAGDIRHLFNGALAELVVVQGTDSLGPVETYFKKKYGL